jgi:hypothetical protein
VILFRDARAPRLTALHRGLAASGLLLLLGVVAG